MVPSIEVWAQGSDSVVCGAEFSVSERCCNHSNQKQRLGLRTMHPLDNVIWTALHTRQSEFAETFGQARKFVAEVSPLAAFAEPTAEGYESLAGLVGVGGTLRLFLDAPYRAQAGWSMLNGSPMPEMVYEGAGLRPADSPFGLAQGRLGELSLYERPRNADTEIVELGAADSAEMIELTALTKPGPFDKRTHELGTYLGIRHDGKLVAMAGERLKIPGYTEVSAVCTHPEHTGCGYARVLMTEVMQRILGRGETPFLHVREDNVRAIELYHRMGFTRRALLYTVALRKDSA
jgi:ribosomal protein S18 acetylase RimI-like enzyme